jgi:acyl-CoA hydrolase
MEQQKRTLVMSEIMTPAMANFSGKVHGGDLLSFLDKVAFACASRYSARYVVTFSVDNVLFKEPIYIGELVTAKASVNFVGRTSMEVGIRVEAENLTNGISRHTNSCFFTMICLDEDGKPYPVAPLNNTDPEQTRRFEEARIRRDLRKAHYDKIHALTHPK